MINKIVKEINTALDYNLYFLALSTALILPDICSKAEYPTEKPSVRYIKWYQKYIGDNEKCTYDNNDKFDFPYMSGCVTYKLRNAIIHEGDPTVKKSESDISEFILIREPKNEFGVYADYAMVDKGNGRKRYKASIRRLCKLICDAAEKYYDKNKERFEFVYKIIDRE